MKKILLPLLFTGFGILVGLFLARLNAGTLNPFVGQGTPFSYPLRKYTFDNLRNTTFEGSQITIGEKIEEEESFESRVFYFTSEGKKVSGMINIPKQKGLYPVAVLFRGFVDHSIYTTGVGTMNVSKGLARNGFITIAPDFLGYGESDMPSTDTIEERFETYTTALNLLASLKNIEGALTNNGFLGVGANIDKTVIWGHSNGGHIALSILAITGRPYPTVLWAPVSKPFPYSVLYFTDEFADNGKSLRKVVANFEKDYDIDLYSAPSYYKWIKAPIQIHQGTDDDAVPLRWSDQLYKALVNLEADAEYFVYPGDDHNLNPNGWSLAFERSLAFYLEDHGYEVQ